MAQSIQPGLNFKWLNLREPFDLLLTLFPHWRTQSFFVVGSSELPQLTCCRYFIDRVIEEVRAAFYTKKEATLEGSLKLPLQLQIGFNEHHLTTIAQALWREWGIEIVQVDKLNLPTPRQIVVRWHRDASVHHPSRVFAFCSIPGKHEHLADFTLKYRDKCIPLHTLVWSSKTSCFDSLFTSHQNRLIELQPAPFEEESVEIVVNYVHTNKLDLNGASMTRIADLMRLAASDFFDLPHLRQLCGEHLCKTVTKDNVTTYSTVADDELKAALLANLEPVSGHGDVKMNLDNKKNEYPFIKVEADFKWIHLKVRFDLRAALFYHLSANKLSDNQSTIMDIYNRYINRVIEGVKANFYTHKEVEISLRSPTDPTYPRNEKLSDWESRHQRTGLAEALWREWGIEIMQVGKLPSSLTPSTVVVRWHRDHPAYHTFLVSAPCKALANHENLTNFKLRYREKLIPLHALVWSAKTACFDDQFKSNPQDRIIEFKTTSPSNENAPSNNYSPDLPQQPPHPRLQQARTTFLEGKNLVALFRNKILLKPTELEEQSVEMAVNYVHTNQLNLNQAPVRRIADLMRLAASDLCDLPHLHQLCAEHLCKTVTKENLGTYSELADDELRAAFIEYIVLSPRVIPQVTE
jgi:hypothetical protein